MTVGVGDAKWGKVDPSAAATSLGVTIPLALLFSAFVLFLGWFNRPDSRTEIIERSTAAPIFSSRPTTGFGARFQTNPSGEVTLTAPA